MKLNLITLLASIFLLATNLKAQTTTPDFKPSHLKAAEQLLLTMGTDKQFDDVGDKIANTTSTQRVPMEYRALYLKVMKVFVGKYVTWDQLKDRIEKLYAAEFTESELNQLTAFYNTPLGKKIVEKLPVFMQKGTLLGQQAVTDHRSELEQMLKDAFQNADPPTIKDQQH